MSKPAQWRQTRERSNMFMLQVMSWVSLHMGRKVARFFLYFIAAYFVVFSPGGRKASRSYLERALGRKPTWLDMFQHFFTFASTIHDRIYLVNRRYDLFNIDIHGREALHDLINEGKGVFLMGAHLGSFEVIRAIGRQLPDLRVAMVMHQDNAQKINAMLAAINPEASIDIIPLGQIDSMLRVQEFLDEGVLVGMLADRTLGDEPKTQVELLGSMAPLPTGPFRMAALLRRPVVFMVGLYMGGNRYQIHFETLADFSSVPRGHRDAAVQAAITRYTALLNHYTRLAPYNWFNFFDYWQTVPNGLDQNKKGVNND
jgi:predicted LPLAT superfamily acyltransferase